MFCADPGFGGGVEEDFPAKLRPKDAATVYAIQDGLIERLVAEHGGHPVGYKIACSKNRGHGFHWRASVCGETSLKELKKGTLFALSRIGWRAARVVYFCASQHPDKMLLWAGLHRDVRACRPLWRFFLVSQSLPRTLVGANLEVGDMERIEEASFLAVFEVFV